MFQISYTHSAREDILTFRKQEQTMIADRIEEHLIHQPNVETRSRKKLRPNQTAQWELRAENYRVLYDVDEIEQRVEVKLVGRKVGAMLFVRGQEYRI